MKTVGENVDVVVDLSRKLNAAEATIEVLTELSGVDKEKLKEQLILRAMKNAAEGRDIGYVGDLAKDVYELVEKLINERDNGVDNARLANQLSRKLSRTYNCLTRTCFTSFVDPCKKYKGSEVNDMIEKSVKDFRQIIHGAIEIMDR